jgi:hypothetical protein
MLTVGKIQYRAYFVADTIMETARGPPRIRALTCTHKHTRTPDLSSIKNCLSSSGQSSWLQMQRSRIQFPALQDFLRSNGSGTGPLSLLRITEVLLERNCGGFGEGN